MRDAHQHCTCNGVWLCPTCHTQVHARPFDSRSKGWIVSRHQAQPGSVPAKSHFGELILECNGRYRYHIPSESESRSTP